METLKIVKEEWERCITPFWCKAIKDMKGCKRCGYYYECCLEWYYEVFRMGKDIGYDSQRPGIVIGVENDDAFWEYIATRTSADRAVMEGSKDLGQWGGCPRREVFRHAANPRACPDK